MRPVNATRILSPSDMDSSVRGGQHGRLQPTADVPDRLAGQWRPGRGRPDMAAFLEDDQRRAFVLDEVGHTQDPLLHGVEGHRCTGLRAPRREGLVHAARASDRGYGARGCSGPPWMTERRRERTTVPQWTYGAPQGWRQGGRTGSLPAKTRRRRLREGNFGVEDPENRADATDTGDR